MRTLAILAASLLAFGGLAGCVGGDKDDDVSPNTVPNTNNLGGAGDVLTVLAPLKGAIAAQANAWVAPGSTFPVSVEAPKNAEGNVTYTWAIGPVPETVEGPKVELDTKNIASGESKTLKFEAAGVYGMHCHPHPYMLHNVTVVEGFQGPAKVTVSIVDGDKPGEYRFVPENILIAPGTEVEYKNVGEQMHTATLSGTEPALKALSLTAASGEVAVEGDGWQRVMVIMQDEAGRIGIASHNVYVKAIPANFHGVAEGSFEFGTGAAPADTSAVPVGQPESTPMMFEHGGRAFVNVTVADPTGQGLNTVSVHLRKQGETQDTMTLNAGTLTSEGIVNAGQYVVEVVAEQGVDIKYTVSIDVVYDLVPPEITKAAPAGDDGHGGHAHH